MNQRFSLYIHIPFCASLCDYCDFFSVSVKNADDARIDSYLNALVNDIENQISRFSAECFTTAYIGGGTPSVLGNKIGFLLDKLNEKTCFKPAEFTIEANPEFLTKEFLDICREGGINRISLGAQTFNEKSRKAVNRNGNLEVIDKNIKLAYKYFKDSLSLDLITGLPFQNEETAAEDIKRALDYNPSHISLYSLSVQDGAALKDKIKEGIITLPDADYADSIWLSGMNTLIEKGFEHYEISNFAKDGKRCVHNLNYWQMNNWLGAGAAASGTVINEEQGKVSRYTYADDIDSYIINPSLDNALREDLDRLAFLKDSLLMGFRCREGPDPVVFKRRFGKTLQECIPKTLNKYKNKDIMLFLNSFLTEAFRELESAGL